MFKVGDKVFDNERGYGEGVIEQIDIKDMYLFDLKTELKESLIVKKVGGL